MKTWAFFVLICADYGFILCYGGYFSTNHCTGYGEELYYDIVCNDPIRFPDDLPKDTEKLTIICSKNVTKNNTISEITHSDIRRYDMLVSFHIQNCPIAELPEKLFTNFPYLQSVTLDGLPIQRLRNIFYQSENLLELVLANLFNLEHVDSHILNSQKVFSKITLDNTSISLAGLKEILKSVSHSVKEFRLINNRLERIAFPPDFFSDYRLGLLDLRNNNIRDWTFLNFTKSRKVLLANSRTSKSIFDLSNYAHLHRYCEMLDLENIGIEGVFPPRISTSFDHTKILILKSNAIETLNNDTDQMFPHLQLLDISFNKIKHLQPDLNNLFYKTELFKLEGNPLHCNCQLRWLSARYKSKIKDFPRCNFAYRNSNFSKSKSVENLYFSQLATDNLICLPPRAPILSISRGEKPTQLIISGKNVSENTTQIKQEYTLIIDSNQVVELICETEGDPTPTLTWSNTSGLILTRDPSSQIDHSFNRLTVGLGGPNVSSIYMCTASNIEGISYALLNLISKKERYYDNNNISNVIYKKIISNQNNRNCATTYFAQIFEFKLDINLVWKILYFLISIVTNIYFF